MLGSGTAAGGGVVFQTTGAVTFFANNGTSVGGSGALTLGGGKSSGTYSYDLSGGTLTVLSVNKRTTNSAARGNISFNGGTLRAARNTGAFMAGLSSAKVRTGGAEIDTGRYNVTIGQALLGSSGDGGLTKLGAGRLSLTGANTYTGMTTLAAGELRATSPAYTSLLNNTGGVNLTSAGAKLILDYAGTSSPVSTVRSILTTSAANGFTSGKIRSTTLSASQTVGYGDDGSVIAIRITLPSDAELDGVTDFNDFLTLQNYFG